MPHKTLASAIEAILNNQCSIKNDDVECLQRACKRVWPERETTLGYAEFYFNILEKRWACQSSNPYPDFITATQFCRLMDEELKYFTTMEDLKKLIELHGGKIVSSNDCDTNEINQARASNRMFVDDFGLGFIWVPIFKNEFPETVEEVELFEKYYPNQMNLPENLSFDNMLRKINEPETKERGITITHVSKQDEPIDLGDVFDNNFDCYTDIEVEQGCTHDTNVYEAMTREKFIEVVGKLLNEKSKS